ncbi:MAG: tRNA-dihydrouridine synthase [bacterium]|nr:tRNA-dihydrouridine synthase [bacterium]
MLFRGFWDNLEKPIIGLSPMDGVTDAAFRYMVCKHSSPSVVMTEFTNVEGLARGATQMLVAFLHNKIERPVVAQIYGVEVDSYYKCAVMLASLGFDGIDINMGCPANKVAKKGSGAGLIQTPKLAKELIRTTKQAVKDWSEGISLEKAGVHPDIIEACKDMRKKCLGFESVEKVDRNLIPVSVKTRIGFDKVVAEEWTKHLLEELPANITMHGRTLRQMYLGEADWDVLAKAAALCKASGVTFLGNGDVKSLKDAHEKIGRYGVNGVLVGRAALGNPWFFGGKEGGIESEISMEKRMAATLEHAKYFTKLNHLPFHNIKKHLAWYCKGFSGARDMRMNLMGTQNLEEVVEIMENI